MKEIITTVVTLVTALGGWEAIKYLLNRKTNARIADANAFKVEREAWIEDYNRVQGEVDELKQQVAKLYKEIDALKDDRLQLMEENSRLKIALKEAEKHVCWRPKDECFQRIVETDHCLYRKLIQGVKEHHPNAIVTKEDMKRKPSDEHINSNENEKDKQGDNTL